MTAAVVAPSDAAGLALNSETNGQVAIKGPWEGTVKRSAAAAYWLPKGRERNALATSRVQPQIISSQPDWPRGQTRRLQRQYTSVGGRRHAVLRRVHRTPWIAPGVLTKASINTDRRSLTGYEADDPAAARRSLNWITQMNGLQRQPCVLTSRAAVRSSAQRARRSQGRDRR